MTELKPRIQKILIFLVSILFTIVFIGILIKNLTEGYKDLEEIGAILFSIIIMLFVSPPLLLSITYFYTDLTKKVIIDQTKNQIVIKKRGKVTIISHDDVMDSFYVKVDDFIGYRSYTFPMYKYIVLILKERERVYITNLLCEPELIIDTLNLNCKTIYRNIPFLNLTLGGAVMTTKEFEIKVLEFENNFQEHSNSMLAEIIDQKNIYADYAREAASRILSKRKQ